MKLTKKHWFALHGWLGLTLGLPLFVICLSGTFAVISPELDLLVNPDMRARPPADDPTMPVRSWDELLASVRQAYPDATVGALSQGIGDGAAYQAFVSLSPEDQRLVYINQHTGQVQGQTTHFNVKSFFRIFHKQWYIVAGGWWPNGRAFVCFFAFTLLLSVFTALMFYKGWWRALWTLRLGKSRRVFWSDLHRMAGVWSLILAVMFGITGVWYFIDYVFLEHDADFNAAVEKPRFEEMPDRIERKSITDCIASARDSLPGFEVRSVFLGSPQRPLILTGDGPTLLDGPGANLIHIDHYSGRVLNIKKADDLSLGRRLISFVDPVHFGRFGGWVTKIIWTVAGLILSLSILVGTYIWWLRAVKKGGASDQAQPFFRRSRFWTVVTLLVNLSMIVAATLSSIQFISGQLIATHEQTPVYSLGGQQLASWHVQATQHGCSGEADSYCTIRFISQGDPNFKAGYAWVGPESRPAQLKPLPRRDPDRLRFPLGRSAPVAAGQTLHLEIEQWSGTVLKAAFPLADPKVTRPLAGPDTPTVPMGVKLFVGLFVLLISVPIVIWLLLVR